MFSLAYIRHVGPTSLQYRIFFDVATGSTQVHPLIAERLNARQLILLRISFCVCMYGCPSRVGMLILCTWHTPVVLSGMHAAALRTLVVSQPQPAPQVRTATDLNDGQQHKVYYRLGARS